MLLHGMPGSGKTTLVGTAAECSEFGEVLFIDLDGGKASLRGVEGSLVEERTAADAETHLWKVAAKAEGYDKVGLVVLDGASELAKAELAGISSASQKRGKREDQDKNELQDYGLLKNRLLRLFRFAKDIPHVSVVITAWTKATFPQGVQPTPEMQPTLLSPDFTKGVGDALAGYVDMVSYLHGDAKTKKRSLVTSAHGNIVAKTRDKEVADALCSEGKPIMQDPTFRKILDAYKKAYKV